MHGRHAKPERRRNRGAAAFSLVETVIALGVIVTALALFSAATMGGNQEARDRVDHFETRTLADAVAEDLRLCSLDKTGSAHGVFGLATLPGDPDLTSGDSETLHLAHDWRPVPAEEAWFTVTVNYHEVPSPDSFAPFRVEIRVDPKNNPGEGSTRLLALTGL